MEMNIQVSKLETIDQSMQVSKIETSKTKKFSFRLHIF